MSSGWIARPDPQFESAVQVLVLGHLVDGRQQQVKVWPQVLVEVVVGDQCPVEGGPVSPSICCIRSCGPLGTPREEHSTE